MMVLVGNTIHELRHREVGILEIGHGLRCVVLQR